ncbi:MAG: hypothetical protein M3Q99_10040 [Acidobacteriota bacterium]|nr:hypothetical protein [Acidobacteriota bacterium]
MKKLLSIIFAFILSMSALGQTELPILGKITDLQGKNKVYLLAASTTSREMMQKVLDKNKSFEIVSDPNDADFILEFKQVSNKNEYDDTGELAAYFYNSDKRKVVAWSESKNYYKRTGMGFPKKNEVYLTMQFLKAVYPDRKIK